MEFLDKYKLIRDSQHGFRKGRSCVTNLAKVLLLLISIQVEHHQYLRTIPYYVLVEYKFQSKLHTIPWD